ncbi:MAG: START domain-containing protein [Gammaproteobacteria bacterium]
MLDFRQPIVRWLLIVLLGWSLPGYSYVLDDGWTLSSGDDEDLQVYTKVVEGQPIKAVKAVKILDAPLKTLLTVLADARLVPDWIPVIRRATLIRDTNKDGASIIYMVTKFPWPIRNRDAVVETVTWYEQDSETVYMESTGVPGYVEESKGIIRTPTTYTRWKIHPLENGSLRVEIITHSDPRGRFPAWLANMIVTRTPATMFSRLEKTVDEELKRDRPFDEIHVFGKEVDL